jgi:hypothetical protein
MKFVLTWTVTPRGSLADSVASTEATLKLLASWQPSPDATIHQWVQRCDGNGGFCVLDTDNPASLTKDLAVWSGIIAFQLYPVLDIGDWAPLQAEALGIVKPVL